MMALDVTHSEIIDLNFDFSVTLWKLAVKLFHFLGPT